MSRKQTIHRSLTDYGARGPLAGHTIVVVGMGPIGIFIALDLAAQGATVIMIAAHPWGVSVGFINAAGLIEPVGTEDPVATELFLRGVAFAEWSYVDPAWATRAREVVFMSDHAEGILQPWIEALPTKRPTHESKLPATPPAYSISFDSFVVQPNRVAGKLRCELHRLNVTIDPGAYAFRSCAEAVRHAQKFGADAVVVAPGLGLAWWEDLWEIPEVGWRAEMFGGIGVTKKLKANDVGIDHVLMWAEEMTYVIPQIDYVIAGGTNDPKDIDEEEVSAKVPPQHLRDLVDAKLRRIHPVAAGLERAQWLMGARPMRETVLTTSLDASHFRLPVVIVGGASGSGWTFAQGLAEWTTRELLGIFGLGIRLPTFPETVTGLSGVKTVDDIVIPVDPDDRVA